MFNFNQINKMVTLSKKQLETVAETVAIAARLDELKRLEGYVPSAMINRRKDLLKRQLRELKGKDVAEKEEEQTVNIKIDLSGATDSKTVKKEKSFGKTLASILSGHSNNDDDDDDDNNVFAVIKKLLPRENGVIVKGGKIITEL
jgi:predicted PP-loop superfamily ATPase